MASLAINAVMAGCKVSGSDDHSDTLFSPVLAEAGVRLYDLFAQATISNQDLVVVSRFFDSRHPEIMAAEKHKIRVVTETEYTKQIIGDRPTLAVLGSYEGPLICAWLSHVWLQARLDYQGLTHCVSDVAPLAFGLDAAQFLLPLTGMKRDSHTYESDFLSFKAQKVIIPSILYDYPELATTLDEVYQAYYTFGKRIGRQGVIIGNSDWSRMKRLRIHLADRHIETYGTGRDALWHIYDVNETSEGTTFSLRNDRKLVGPFFIPHHGPLFVSSATAVIIASLLEDLSLETIQRGLKHVPKVRRYFETVIAKSGRVIIDDAADHPSTLEDVLLLVRERYPNKKIWCLYQSGSYMRSKALQSDFEASLSLADFVYIADIKGQPKEKSETLHARHLVASLRQIKPQTFYFNSASDTISLLDDRVATQDCIVALGVEGICQEVIAGLAS